MHTVYIKLISLFRRLRGEDRTGTVQLSEESLKQIALNHKPLAEWPVVDEGIFAPGTFKDEPNSTKVHEKQPRPLHA